MNVVKSPRKAQVEAIYPLSPMQQGMLFNALLNTGANTDFVQLRFILRGELDVALLRTAWEGVAARHSILRTQFKWDGVSQPLQIVWRQIQLPWIEYDWREIAPDEQETRLQYFLQADLERGIELTRAPLFRLTIIRQPEDCYQLVWSYHHILLDGWSNGTVLREVFALYEAAIKQQEVNLSPPHPYKNYISWLQKQDRAQAETFWREQLKGITSATVVFHRARSEQEPIRNYRELRRTLTQAATARLQQSAQQHQLTLNTLFQGAWSFLLGCYSGDRSVVSGSVVAGRPGEIPGIDDMVGLFINTLPVRVDIEPQMKLLDWLEALQQQQLTARQYEYLSLVEIQKWSQVPAGEPLFESLVVLANYGGTDHSGDRIGNVVLEEAPASVGRTTFPLVVGAGVSGTEQLVLGITYDADRFTAVEITRMLEHLAVLLETMPEQLERPLALLSPLTAHEKQQILFDWNATSVPYPDTASLSDLIKAQVKAHPDAVALAFEEQQLTYHALDILAERLASRLQQQGIGPEVLAGVCVERSLEMVIAILGVFYAGGAYVPLDPVYPEERLSYMCTDAQIAVLITQPYLADRFSSLSMPVLTLDCAVDLSPAENFVYQPVQPDHLAYVIYTSGSTGKPKGCMVPHRGLCNLSVVAHELCGDLTGARVLQFASLSFDASIADVVIALTGGATLQLINRDTMLASSALFELLERCAVQSVTLPPSVLAALPMGELPALQTVIVSGEACSAELVQRWSPGRHFYNVYGPTETTVGVTRMLCQPEQGRPSIGTPFPNTELYILDANLQPVPVGTPGELYVGGVNLARGYLKRPELTAERFIPHPFSATKGSRLYKTGDVVKYREDGQVDFIGRSDHQVKIRGVRIELGEIEAVLDQVSSVQHSVVVVREDQPGEKRLIAYLVPESGQQITIEEVQESLHRHLSHYMIPAALVVLDELPLTPNGKVDQKQLPPPERQVAPSTTVYQPPRDETEMQLVQIYEAVLRVQPVGIMDDFFMLGGHSLLAVHLMSEIQKRLQTPIALSVIFQHRTVAALANVLRQGRATPSSPLVALRSEGAYPPFFAVHPANGQAACYYSLVSHLPPEQPFYGLQDLGLYVPAEAEKSVEELARTYLDALFLVQPQGPYYLGGYSFGGIVAFEMAQQLHDLGQEVAWLAIIDGASPAQEGQAPPPATDLDLLATIVGEAIHRVSGKTIQDVYNELQPLTSDQQFEHAFQLLRAANVDLLIMEKAWLKEQVELFARRLRVAQAYKARTYTGPITLFRSQEEDRLEHEQAEEEDLGWQHFSQSRLEVHTVPGYHASIMTEPHVQQLADLFWHSLEQRYAETQARKSKDSI